MGDFMLAPKITIVQPYGLFGIGLIRTAFTPTVGTEEDDNNFGYNVGGGLIIYFNKHFGLKGDVRYYHAFDALSILGINLPNAGSNKLDFGRVGLGTVIDSENLDSAAREFSARGLSGRSNRYATTRRTARLSIRRVMPLKNMLIPISVPTTHTALDGQVLQIITARISVTIPSTSSQPLPGASRS